MNLENLDDLQYSIEIAILNTYLSGWIMKDKDYAEIIDTVIDYNLFTKTITNKAVAKAIFIYQEKDHPFDELIIKDFLDSKMTVNDIQYADIICRGVLLPRLLKHYLKLLKEKNTKDNIGANLARI